jgi:ribosome maturation factor RimP
MADLADQLAELFGPYLAAEGIELDDLEVVGNGRGRVVRVTVDADGGIDVDRIAETARGLSRLADEADPMPGSYNLEVGSPGLERSLRRPSHYRKSVGREVKVKTVELVEGRRVHHGVLQLVDDEGFTLVDDESTQRLRYSEVASAHTVFRWEPAPKPGARR